jgi:hypothetical protein
LLALASGVRAGPIVYKYDWTLTPGFVLAGSGIGGVTFPDEPERQAMGSSAVIVSRPQVFSVAKPSAPDVFGPNDGFFSLQVKLTDVDSGLSGSLTFNARILGSGRSPPTPLGSVPSSIKRNKP